MPLPNMTPRFSTRGFGEAFRKATRRLWSGETVKVSFSSWTARAGAVGAPTAAVRGAAGVAAARVCPT